MKMDQWSLACRDLAGVERKGTRPLSTVELKAAAIQFVDQLRQKLLLDITPLQPHHLVDLRATIERLLMRR
jgi:hypothetical protein